MSGFYPPAPSWYDPDKGIQGSLNAIHSKPAAKPASDHVDHPAHYNTGKIEVIDAIDDWRLGFALGNAVKYIARAGKKDPAKTIEDLEKARWYLDHEIRRLTK